jgi:hypothetical protein
MQEQAKKEASRRETRVFSFWDDGFTAEVGASDVGFATWAKTKNALQRRGYLDLTDRGVLQRLYDSEINIDIRLLPNGTFEAKLGDACNGHVAEKTFTNWQDLLRWFRDQAVIHFPASVFASEETGKSRDSLLSGALGFEPGPEELGPLEAAQRVGTRSQD